nr:MAG TPA: hypothetical protein [Caudoviricetes sp.]
MSLARRTRTYIRITAHCILHFSRKKGASTPFSYTTSRIP